MLTCLWRQAMKLGICLTLCWVCLQQHGQSIYWQDSFWDCLHLFLRHVYDLAIMSKGIEGNKAWDNVTANLFRSMLRFELTWRLPMLSTRLRQTSIDVRRCFRRVIWWWRICGVVDPLVFMPSWNSESTVHFTWHQRLMIMLMCFSCWTIRISLTLSTWLICLLIIQVVRSCISLTWERVLF